MNKKQTHLL